MRRLFTPIRTGISGSDAAATSRIKISPSCSTAPRTSPVWPPNCRMQSHASNASPTASRTIAQRPAAGPRRDEQRDHAEKHRSHGAHGRRPPDADGKAVDAGRRDQPHEQRHAGAGRHVSGNENRRRNRGRGNARERGRAQQERHRQRAGAIGSDPAVAHDLELALARVPAEGVGHVRQPVFMQASGHDQGRRDRQAGGGQRWQAGQTGEPIDPRGNQAHDRAGDGERPARHVRCRRR